jgi:Zn finger protein HypA/HybF involved in hydrogenase expression
MARQGSGRLLRLGVGIGELAGVDRQSLAFCLEAALAEEHWEQVETVFTTTAVEVCCRTCKRRFQPPRHDFRCADCQAADVEVLCGDGVALEWLEVD